MCVCGNMWSAFLSICAWVDIGHMPRQRSHSSMGGCRFGRSRAWGRPGWGSALTPWEAGRCWVPVNCLSFPFGLGSCPLTFLTEKLRQQLKETQRAAFAEGTHKNLLTQWKTFLVFCDRYQYQAMPVSTDMICLYAKYLANKLKSPQTVRNCINTVRVLQVLVDQPIEAFRSPDLKLTFRGFARLRQHQPKRAQAITPEMLCHMHKFINVSDTLDLVVWAAILVAFFCMLRESNYVPESSLAYKAKVPGELIKVQGDWASDAYMAYLSIPHWAKNPSGDPAQ